MEPEPASPDVHDGPQQSSRMLEQGSPAASPELVGRRKGEKRLRPAAEDGPGQEPEPSDRKKKSLVAAKAEAQEQAPQKPDAVGAAVAGDGPSASSDVTNRRRQGPRIGMRNLLNGETAAEAALRSKLVGAAPWIVHVSSTAPDGTENLRCSSVVIHWSKEERRARILTSCGVIFCTRNGELYDPTPKLDVRLPNMDIIEGRLLFFSENYQLALLEIAVNSCYDVKLPNIGCSPCYGQEVSTLARDRDLSLKLRHGSITWLEEDHFMFLDCKLPRFGTGGPVINNNGDLIGISDDQFDDPSITSITTILTCVEMWTRFSRIARPILGMCLRTVGLLDIMHHEVLRSRYGINNGFIVDEVVQSSAAEKCGIRRGNVISLFNGISSCYLPQFEDFLLSFGLDSLRGMLPVTNFKLEVHDLLGKVKRTITLPIQFSDGSEY